MSAYGAPRRGGGSGYQDRPWDSHSPERGRSWDAPPQRHRPPPPAARSPSPGRAGGAWSRSRSRDLPPPPAPSDSRRHRRRGGGDGGQGDRDDDRDRGRRRDKGRGERSGRERDKEKARKALMAQQMAMMQGMMNPAMHMAMMQGAMPGMPGMMNPAMMGMMQGMPPMPGSKKNKKGRGGDGAEAEDGSSSSSDSSDSSDAAALGPAAAMAAMAAMWPNAAAPHAPPPMMPHPPAGPSDMAQVEDFIAQAGVTMEAARRLRALPPHLQQAVLRRGMLTDARNPDAVLLTRIRDAEKGERMGDYGSTAPRAPPPPQEPPPRMEYAGMDDMGPRPARRSAKAAIEQMVSDFRLSPGCAWMMRSLPPDKQKLAARIDPSGQADPSGYVAEQLRRIV